MGAGRRFGRGGGGGGGGGGRNQRMLKHHIDCCKKKCSTVDDIVQHLRERHPNYRRMELKTLTRLVSFIQKESSPSREPHRPINRKRGGGEDEDGKSSPAVLQKRTKWSGDDEEGGFIRLGTTSYSDEDPDSDSESKSVSASKSNLQSSSTSEDAVYGEKVEPEFDFMRSMLREKYMPSASKEKSVEVEEGESERVVKTLGTERRREGENVRNLSHKTVTGEEQDRGGGPRFKDLGGMKGVLEELETEVFLPFYHPEVPKRLGVDPISGILLHGPPGCGKTKLACAIANEAGVPFYKISATEVVSGVSGASEENIRELFTKAYRTAPSIVFIDEIDAIGSKRENLQREMEKRIVTQLMTCMDSSSFSDQSPGRILVIGATNRPDALDPALRRPGRFDREINLGIPDENARVEILSVLTRKCTLEGSINLLQIARSTSGFVGADLNAVVNKAGSIAMKRIFLQRKLELSTRDEWLKTPWSDEDIKKLAITMTDFEKAIKLVQPSLLREGFSTIPNVTWEDVGGLDDIRREFEFHIIKRIKYPEVYQQFGVNLDTGILLYGPPGCGKTLIAMAVANEAGANFILIKGPEVLNKYVGESELAVRTIFSRARSCSPCVLFFDEIDALTTKRGEEGGWVVERLVNQLLAEFGSDRQPGVFIIGATNRPEVMDPALLRPGRFGKILYVPLPSAENRGSILKTLARGKPVDPNIDLSAIGRMEACEKLSGADLRKLMEEAAGTAVEEKMEEEAMSRSCEEPCFIKANHFEQALSKISPSVSDEQLQYYKIWSEHFRKT